MSPVDSIAPTLAELGIAKFHSRRWQAVASVPDDVFEAHLAEAKDSGDELTTAGVVRLARRIENDAMRSAISSVTASISIGNYRQRRRVLAGVQRCGRGEKFNLIALMLPDVLSYESWLAVMEIVEYRAVAGMLVGLRAEFR